jgi:hypothetical protein
VAVFVVRKKAGDRFVDKSSRVQKWQMFSESDRRGLLLEQPEVECVKILFDFREKANSDKDV